MFSVYSIYGETVERKIKEHNVLTAVSILPDTRTPSQLVEELTAQGGLFAIFINPQNEIHRSLTLNILHGTPQGMVCHFCHSWYVNCFIMNIH